MKEKISALDQEMESKNDRIQQLEDLLAQLQENGADASTQMQQLLDERRRLEK